MANGASRRLPAPTALATTAAYSPSRLERSVAAATAIAIVATVLFLVVSGRQITDDNVASMFRIILSLAVAILGANIPGFLQVGWDVKGLSIRAGGALGLFVICYFASPPIIKGENKQFFRVEAALQRIADTTDEDEIDREIREVYAVASQDQSGNLQEHAMVLIQKYLEGTFDASGDFVRVKRRELVELMMKFKNYDLRKAVPKTFFSQADLVGVNFSKGNLSGLEFEGAFMITADFKGANLENANLQDAFVRYADFTGAKLSAAKLNNLDWFNAVGFTADQLSKAAPNTVVMCPGENEKRYDEAGFIKKHDSLYARVRFADFDKKNADDFRVLWAHYAGPTGACGLLRARTPNTR